MILCAPSSPLQYLLRQLEQVAVLPSTVLLLGESGCGKELAARHLHHCSQRCREPFVAVNCAAIAPALLESELFGHEKGAFTGADSRRVGSFEAANRGTLFLDEIGELPLAAQASLLRILQERRVCRVGGWEEIPVDFRLVAATHRDLWELVGEKKFREDLFFRLHVVPLRIPPLRERMVDLPVLAEGLIERIGKRMGLASLPPWQDETPCLARHDWPGNVRELENLLERFLALHGLGVTLDELVEEACLRGKPFGDTAMARERKGLKELLVRHGGKRSLAAQELGIGVRALGYRLAKLGLAADAGKKTPHEELRELCVGNIL